MDIDDATFLKELLERESENDVRYIDFLYDYIDDLLDVFHFSRIDAIVLNFIDHNFRLRTAIAFLTIIHPKRTHIPNQVKLVAYARLKAIEKNLSKEQIEAVVGGF